MGLLVVIGGAVGITLALSQASSSNLGAEAPADPIDTGEVATPTEPEVFQRPLDQLTISADVLNNQDELATQFIEERVTEWINHGATPENVVLAYDFDGGIRAFAEQLAAQSDQAFIDSLVISGWENTPLKSWVDKIKQEHVEALVLYFSTARPDLETFDIVPFTMRDNYTSIESYAVNADGSVTLQTIEHSEDNSEQNTVGENPNYTVIGIGDEYRVVRIFVNENGIAKLASIESVVI